MLPAPPDASMDLSDDELSSAAGGIQFMDSLTSM
jgi:hypothetical protein